MALPYCLILISVCFCFTKFLAIYLKLVYNLIIKLKENTHGKLVRGLNYYLRKIYEVNFII